jgi:hypothetical protein
MTLRHTNGVTQNIGVGIRYNVVKHISVFLCFERHIHPLPVSREVDRGSVAIACLFGGEICHNTSIRLRRYNVLPRSNSRKVISKHIHSCVFDSYFPRLTKDRKSFRT